MTAEARLAPTAGPPTAWDALLDRLDVLVAEESPEPEALRSELTALLVDAQAEGLADAELDPLDAGRWLATLVLAHAQLHVGDERALATLRVVVTRWLHPPRLDLAAARALQAAHRP